MVQIDTHEHLGVGMIQSPSIHPGVPETAECFTTFVGQAYRSEILNLLFALSDPFAREALRRTRLHIPCLHI